MFCLLGAKFSVSPLIKVGAKLSGAKLSGAKLSRCQIVWHQIVHFLILPICILGAKLSAFILLVSNWPGAKLHRLRILLKIQLHILDQTLTSKFSFRILTKLNHSGARHPDHKIIDKHSLIILISRI